MAYALLQSAAPSNTAQPRLALHVWHGEVHVRASAPGDVAVTEAPPVPLESGALLAFVCGDHGRVSAADVRAMRHVDYPWCPTCLDKAQRQAPDLIATCRQAARHDCTRANTPTPGES